MNPDLEIAIEATQEAGKLTLKYFGGNSEFHRKSNGDPLSEADLAADKLLKEQLHDCRPDYGWLSEETVDNLKRLNHDRVWIVDPIDGTREFVEGIPEYVVSVALTEGGIPILGVQYNPVNEQLFIAIKDGGAFLNGKRIFSSECTQLSQACSAVSRTEKQRGEIEVFQKHIRKIVPVGSVAYKLALVAAGIFDLNFSVKPKNEWDICAGDLLIHESGGCLIDIKGNRRRYNQRNTLIGGGIIAGNKDLTTSMVALYNDVYIPHQCGDKKL